jgi:hypothetical protein
MDAKIPDRRAMEKLSSDLSKLLQKQDFESAEDLKAYLDDAVKGKVIPAGPPKTAIDFAQDIMYEAWETDNRKNRIRLAKEALIISPDCADAYNLLAEEEAKTLGEAKELYQKGINAGRRALIGQLKGINNIGQRMNNILEVYLQSNSNPETYNKLVEFSNE